MIYVKKRSRQSNAANVISDVCRLLKSSRNTLDLWLKREEQTGDYQAITNCQKGCRHKITDGDRWRAFAQEYGAQTQAQIALLWGDNVTQQNISDALHKMGLSRKKRLTAIENGMNASLKRFKHD